jgi:hypothetical protein
MSVIGHSAFARGKVEVVERFFFQLQKCNSDIFGSSGDPDAIPAEEIAAR